MLHQLSSLWQTDAGIALTGALVLFGWFSGVLFMLVWFWRRLTKPAGEERRLRLALEDADAGLKAELATARRELRDNDVRGMNSVEAAVRSPSILDYMNHWEGRCLKAEAKLAALGKGGSDD
jgi:hypothetical protein